MLIPFIKHTYVQFFDRKQSFAYESNRVTLAHSNSISKEYKGNYVYFVVSQNDPSLAKEGSS